MGLAEDLVNKALYYVGYVEKKSNSNLDDFTANAGDNNYTKFGRDYDINMNCHLNGQPWCAMFVSQMYVETFGLEKAKQLLGGNLFASCGLMKNNAIKKGIYKTSNPKIGEPVIFKRNGKPCHTGIVRLIENGKIYTIEGNTSNRDVLVENGGSVARKVYDINSTYIDGYININYEDIPQPTPTPIPNPNVNIKYLFGIDISSNQGNIDFRKVSKQVDFIILRSTVKGNGVDKKWNEYLSECDKYQIHTECYKYSYARTVQESIAEAESVIRLLNGRKMRIWLDLENSDQLNAIGKTGITQVASAFILTCEKYGYEVGLYFNYNWYKNYIDKGLLVNHKFWIARYGKNNRILDWNYRTNENEYMWQYCSVGRIDGINTNVDLDVCYDLNMNNNKTNISTNGVSSATQIKKGTVKVNTVLRVRSGAGEEYPKVDSLPNGTVVTIYSTVKSKDGSMWYKIGECKYCSANYVIV